MFNPPEELHIQFDKALAAFAILFSKGPPDHAVLLVMQNRFIDWPNSHRR
jgi:hypothetical protein